MTTLSAWQSLGLVVRGHSPAADPSRPHGGRKRTGDLLAVLFVLIVPALMVVNYGAYQVSRAFSNMDRLLSSPPGELASYMQTHHGTIQPLLTLFMGRDKAGSLQAKVKQELVRIQAEAPLPGTTPQASNEAIDSATLLADQPAIAVHGPSPQADWMRIIITTHAGRLADPEATTSLQWTPATRWALTSSLSPEEAKNLRAKLVLATVDWLGQQPPPAMPTAVRMAPPDVLRGTLGLLRDSLVLLLHVPFLLVAWSLPMVASFLGYRWDLERSKGWLEPWLPARHPPWVLYGSQLASLIKWGVAVFLALMLTAAMWGLPLWWGWLFSILVCGVCVALMAGMWGMLATVLFHHVHGRQFARFVLSPAPVAVVWSIRLVVMHFALQAAHPVHARQMVHHLIESGPGWVWGVSAGCLAVAAVLAKVIVWRLGPRRQGLRATV